MSFITFSFALFFILLAFLFYFASNLKKNALIFQQTFLFLASFIFYSSADLRFIPFLIYIIIISWCGGLFCKNRYSLIFFIALLISPLLFFKYAPIKLHSHIIFPLGLSFFTFQAVSYVVDCYKKTIAPEKNILIVAQFISFFPVITSGPIQRPKNLIPQLKTVHKFNYYNVTDGMKLFAWGLFKKLCIADRIAIYVNYVYGSASEQYGLALLFASCLYSLQIYCDFSGYSDMAIGISNFMGFDVGKNFDHPYFSKSIGEFWRRWHISLSTWLRDYIYIPLGGSHVALPRIYLNLFITFLISGIWHGSTWNFIIWGLLHGLYMCTGRVIKDFKEKLNTPVFIRIFITFCLVTFAWIFFRAENLHQAGLIIDKIFRIPENIINFVPMKKQFGMTETIRMLFSLTNEACTGFRGMASMILVIFIFSMCEIITYNNNGIAILKKNNIFVRWSLYIIFFIFAFLNFTTGISSNFIYNNF